MDRPLTAVYDANILYPAPLRDLFIRLAQAGLVRARWTDQIHEEWIRNVIADNPELSPDRLARPRSLMNEAIRDCLVDGYETLIPGLALPDPDDRHVLAAAIRAGADVIVTFNLTDFPPEALRPLGIEAEHPDEFVMQLLDLAPGPVCIAVKRQRENLKRPPMTVQEFLDALVRHSLPGSQPLQNCSEGGLQIGLLAQALSRLSLRRGGNSSFSAQGADRPPMAAALAWSDRMKGKWLEAPPNNHQPSSSLAKKAFSSRVPCTMAIICRGSVSSR